MLIINDFFAGIGGIRTGIENILKKQGIDYKIPFFSDIKKESLLVYNKIYGNEDKNLGDIRKIVPDKLDNFDIFLGGFPCQSYSMAGRRKGLSDERGQLIYNILDIVEEKKPKILFLENVKGITNIDNGNTIKEIVNSFKELGYIMNYYEFNSKDFGVPQSRQRVYFIGFHNSYNINYNTIFEEIEKLKNNTSNKKIKDIIEYKYDYNDYILNDREAKMVLLKDSFCGTLKGVNGISNGVTKNYGKVSGQSTKIILNNKTGEYLDNKEVEELYKEYKEYSKLLKEKKIEWKKNKISNKEKSELLKDFFNSFQIKEDISIRVFTEKELGRLQGYEDYKIDIIIENIKTYKGVASLFGDSVSVPVIEKIAEKIFNS